MEVVGPGYEYQEEGAAEADPARDGLLRDIADRCHKREDASATVSSHPELEAMVAMLADEADGMDPALAAHLRKMIALEFFYYYHMPMAAGAVIDADFYGWLYGQVGVELGDLSELAMEQELPEDWNLAYRDLLRLETPGQIQ